MVPPSEHRIKELLSGFKGKRIAVVGDLMVDRYYWGTVTRVSPEAPVPVVEVDSESVRLGGAANVANNIHALGGEPVMVGLIGKDHAGSLLLDILHDQSFDSSGIVVDSSRPTTIKTRVIAHGQHVVRIDNEAKTECPEHLHHRIIDAVKYNIHRLDGIILEDYNKGVFTRSVIEELISVARKYVKIITVDPKFNNFFEYKHVTVFKPNRKEVEEVLGGKLDSIASITQAGKKLLEMLSAENILLTRGQDGMSLFEASGTVSHMGSLARNVQDVSGAGDSVISALTMALVSGSTVPEAAVLANCAGGIAVGAVGIAPVQLTELMAAALEFSNNHRPGN